MNTGYTQSMYFNSNNNLVTENNQLRLELQELQKEIQILRGQPSDYASLHSKISSLNQENRNLVNERSALLTQIAQLKGTTASSPHVNMDQLRTQVELLLQENDRLSQALKSYKEKSSFLEQSREFRGGDSMIKESAGNLEAKLALLTEENDRLNVVINEREQEIEHLKSKLLPVDSMQITLLEHENTIVVLSTENEKLRVMLNDREREIETFKMRNNSYSMDQSSIIHEQHELKERCELLTQELERIHHEYNDKTKEIQDLKEHIKAIGGNPRASASLELQNERFSVERQGFENQLAQVKQERDQFRFHVEDLEIRNEALEGNLEKLVEEKESLKAEIELWKSKYNVLNENMPEVERNDPHLSILREENNQIRALIIEQNAQITTLKEQVEELDVTLAGKEGVIREADKKFKMLLAENERVNKILVQKKKEIEGLQSKLSKGKGLEEKIAILVMENQNVVASLQEQQRENEHLRANLQSLHDINSPRDNIHTLEEENTRLHYKDQENMRTIEILKERLAHQESRIAEKSQELHNSNIHKMTVEVAEQKCKDMEAKVNLFIKENEDLVVALLQREKEAEGLKRELFQYRSVGNSLGDLHTRIQQLVSENEELAAELEEKCEENEKWKARVKSLEERNQKANELENKMQTMQSENLRISTVLRNQEDEHENLKQSYAQLQREWNKTSKQEKVLENLQDENDHLKEELQETKRELEAFRKKLEKYSEMSAKVKELEVDLEIQKSEYDALLETIRGREEDVKMWRDKAEALEMRIGNFEELEEKELLLKQDLEELKEILRIKSMEVQAVDDQRLEIERLRERIKFLLMQKVLANALNESLRASLDDLSEKNTAFQGKFNAVKDVYLQELKRVANKLDDVERNNEILKQEVANKEEETALAREKYSSIQRVETFIGEFEERVRLLGEENENLAGDLKQRTSEIEKLRKILSDNEREKSELRTKVLEIESMEKSNSQDLHEKRIENEKLHRQIKDNQREIEKWRTKSLEFENSHKRLVDLEEKCRELTTEKGRLNLLVEEKEFEIGTWKDKCNTMEKRGNNRAVQLDRKVEVLETEVERLNNLIIEYDREGERYRNRITDLENKNNLYNSQTEGQRESIKFSAQSSILKKTTRSPFAEFKEKVEDVQNNTDLAEENARLARELNQRVFEFENLRGKYEALEQNLVERIRELDEEVNRLTEKNEALNNLLALQDEETESPNKMGIVLRELEAQIDDLKQENEELRERHHHHDANGMNGEESHHVNIQELEKRIKELQEENQILIETYKMIAKGEEKKNTSSNRSRLSNQSLETFQLQEKLIQAVSANEKLSQENLELRRRHQNQHHHHVFEDKENKRFSEIADESAKEVEKLKAQVKGLQMSLSQYKSFKERVEVLERENQRLSAGARDTYNSSDQRIHFSLHQARDSVKEEDPDNNLITHVLLCSEIERLHLILFEINDTHQEQIEKVNVEWEKLVDAYTMRMRELERDNEELRIRMAGETYEAEEYEQEA